MEKVWVAMEKRRATFRPAYHLTRPSRWVWEYTVEDPVAFIEHMRRYHRITGGALSRSDYEQVCVAAGIEPLPDTELTDLPLQHSDFGLSHYHTDPANRGAGIANTIHQRRFWGLQQEAVVPQGAPDTQTQPPKKSGQLFEPCERCGEEPVYMPLHLCGKCWPTEE